MNALLGIAADFFEHLTDPAFGREANLNRSAFLRSGY
jgi:hypothetical protein